LVAADFSNVVSETSAVVTIDNNGFLNTLGIPETVLSNVVIDGGMLKISQGQRIPNSRIDYTYRVSASSRSFPTQVFCSSGELATDSTGINVSFDPRGGGGCNGGYSFVDLHASFSPSTWTLTIPTSFQTFDFGVLTPHDSMSVTYAFDFDLHHGAQAG